MALHHILVLALIQGLTEFLPISSSGHLVVTGKVLGWSDQGLAIDVAVHLGSLLAVLLYFWRDIWQLLAGVGRLATGRGGEPARLVVNLVVASLPVLIVGYFAKPYVESVFRNVEVIAWATIGFGLLLWIADWIGMTIRRIEHIGIASALAIGLMQIFALIPGASRSGVTMTAGRVMGMERSEAARFSMLLSIPTILAAGGLAGWDVYRAGDLRLGLDMAIAAGLSFVSAFVAISAMMAWFRRSGFGPFVIYRLVLGGALLWWVYSGAVPI
ncbi:undecaprenyl-diphosphate phosphatase [Marivibrio halodurans]|uniref:Undecaprenyl-diphosphatase n=1 Tax=Marivibrio halodurans TaxID=2039722 RepID=A0A8J7S9K3_9PROT|nr:undecaprenyl-diphosphate phosphatase [Marivibrio halodurans]